MINKKNTATKDEPVKASLTCLTKCIDNKAETGSGANQSVPKKKEEKQG